MRIGHAIVPASDMQAQLDFYGALGLTTKFRDGDRYAAVTDGNVTFGLADESQQPVPGRVMMSFEVKDLDVCLAQLGDGGSKVEEPIAGPHERSSVVIDPGGNPLVIYEKLP